jgi:hypothetical protein
VHEILRRRRCLLGIKHVEVSLRIYVSSAMLLVVSGDGQTRSTILHNGVAQVDIFPAADAIVLVQGAEVFDGWGAGCSFAGGEGGEGLVYFWFGFT